jgi:ABC-type nitrate/sulfonate/bicarbonate transport system ATPase subunit
VDPLIAAPSSTDEGFSLSRQERVTSARGIADVALPVSVTSISKHFGPARASLPVIDRVSLAIQPGEFLALLGPSGCGKSTLLRLLAGLDRPTHGSVALGDEPVRGVDSRCSVVFQEPRLLPWRTVASNVALGVRRRGQRDGIGTIIDRVGLTGFERAYPHQLSGGMAQRAALARGLVGEPEVLLLDEPFAALDALTRMRMQDLLLQASAVRQPTVVLVTHDVDEALYLADRIVILGSRPATVAATIPVGIPRPRRRDDPALLPLRGAILAHFGISPVAGASGQRPDGHPLIAGDVSCPA